MTYEEITKANESIKTTDIEGKDYAEVNQRIKAFRMVEPDGAIIPEIVKLENGTCVMKATILDGNGKVLAIGHAYENEGSTFINKTSYIENCETSAVGRALGMCGFGIDTSIASYEEVSNAIENQKPKIKPTSQENKKVEQVAKKEDNKPFKTEEPKPLTLEEARQMGFTSNGKEYVVATMTDEQLLAMKDYTKLPRLAEACSMELAERAKARVENEQGQNS